MYFSNHFIKLKLYIYLKPVLHDASNTFKRWSHDSSPHSVAVMHVSSDKCLCPMLALERLPPKVGIFDPRQRRIQRWKQVATSIWYTATRCDMCSRVSRLEYNHVISSDSNVFSSTRVSV